MGASVRPTDDPALRLQYLKETGQHEEAAKYEQYLKETGQHPHATPVQQFGTALAQGATLGFAPKILGGIDATNKLLPKALGGESAPLSSFGRNYEATRDRISSAEADAMTDHPIAGPLTEMAGGALAALPMAGGAAVGALKPSMGRQILRGAATGAGVGGTAGAGHATGGVLDYAKEIGKGAGIGAVAGGVAVPVLAAAGAAGGKALTTLGLRPTGRTAEQIAADAALMRAPVGPQAGASEAAPLTSAAVNGAPPASGRAPLPPLPTRVRAAVGRGVEASGVESSRTLGLREIARRLELDNVTPADAVAFAQQNAGKPVMPLDLGGGNVSGLARTAKDVPGLGRRLIPEALHERSSGNDGATLGRITNDIEARIGLKPEDYYKSVEDMTGEMKSTAAKNYGKIRNTVIDDPEVLSLFDDPEWRGVHERIRTNARLGGKEKIPPLASMKPVEPSADALASGIEKSADGSVEMARSPNAQTLGTLDKMKRHLDKVISGKIEGGPLDKDQAFNMRERLNTILGQLDEQHPDYKAARAAYRGSAEGIDAYEAGKAEFMKLDPRAIRAKLAKMPERLQDLYRRGGYDALRADKLTKMDDGANIGAWLEKNPDIRDRVSALAKSPDAAEALRGDLGVERAMGDRKNAILGGPNTAERLIEHAATVPRVTQLGNAARMLPGVGKLAGGLVDNTLTRRMSDQTGDVMGEVAKMMVSRGPDAMQELMQAIEALRAGDASKALSRSTSAGRAAALGTRELTKR